MRKIFPFMIAVLIACLFFASGCIYLNESKPLSSLQNDLPKNQALPSIQENAKTQDYQIAALGGVFSEGDKVEFLGVKGTIISGKIENNKVIGGPPFQINNETGAVLIYASTTSTHGFAELFHYPQRGSGEGEGDLYLDGELIATVKIIPNFSFNAYILIACEPEKYPDNTQSVITRHKKCE